MMIRRRGGCTVLAGFGEEEAGHAVLQLAILNVLYGRVTVCDTRDRLQRIEHFLAHLHASAIRIP